MSIPLDTLVDKDVNVYEMTCVAIKEAAIMAADKEAEAALMRSMRRLSLQFSQRYSTTK